MSDLNTFTGNLGRAPELRFTTNGTPVLTFSIGNTPRRLDQTSNEWKDGETLWLRVEAWNALAENAAASLQKGTRVVVTGKLVADSYTDRETNEKVSSTKLKAEEIAISLRNVKVGDIQRSAPSNGNSSGRNNASGTRGNSAPASNQTPVSDDDAPF